MCCLTAMGEIIQWNLAKETRGWFAVQFYLAGEFTGSFQSLPPVVPPKLPALEPVMPGSSSSGWDHQKHSAAAMGVTLSQASHDWLKSLQIFTGHLNVIWVRLKVQRVIRYCAEKRVIKLSNIWVTNSFEFVWKSQLKCNSFSHWLCWNPKFNQK